MEGVRPHCEGAMVIGVPGAPKVVGGGGPGCRRVGFQGGLPVGAQSGADRRGHVVLRTFFPLATASRLCATPPRRFSGGAARALAIATWERVY